MGRPSKFTPAVREKIVQALRGGAHRSTAAQFGGVSHTTLRNWMLLAESPDAPPEYVEFAEEVQKAEADAEIIRLARLNKAGADGSWQADAWWLERKNPEKWGKKDRTQMEITGADGGPITVQASLGADPAAIGALAAILADRHASRQDPLAPPKEAPIEAKIVEPEELDPEPYRIAPGELGQTMPSLGSGGPSEAPGAPQEAPVSSPEVEEFVERREAHREDQRLQNEFDEIVAEVDIPEAWSAWDDAATDPDTWDWDD